MRALRYEEIEIGKISPNNWNTNYMIENERSALQREIDSVGVLKPIVAWEKQPGVFEIIDGEQRYVLYKDKNVEKVKCVVLEQEEIDTIKESVRKETGKDCTPQMLQERFKIITHNLNEIKGTPSIQKILEHYKNSDVKQLYDTHLKFNMSKLKELLEKSKQGVDIAGLMPGMGGRDFMVFQFLIKGQEDIALVKNALDKTSTKNRNDALLALCREFVVKP